jgi:uncharacterized protein YbaP (TraB family)
MVASSIMFAFFLSFLLVLAQVSSANAETKAQVTCKGKDLIADYMANDPEKLAALRVESAKIINGKSIFWKIEKPGLPVSYLLGTMHMADSRIVDMSGLKQIALDNAETVIVENIEALDPAQAGAAMMQHKDITLYTDGTTLSERLDEETLEKLKAATKQRGIPFSIAQIMRPWLIATSVAVPPCEIASKQAGEPVLDGIIAAEAKAQGKTLIGLETVGEQFSAMANLPEAFHLEALKETLNMGDLAEDVIETMKLLYIKGEIGMIQPLTRVVSPSTSSSKDFEAFNQSLITDRNAVMAERALPYIEKGNVFMAVGALHLPGEEGLVELIRGQDFTVTSVE